MTESQVGSAATETLEAPTGQSDVQPDTTSDSQNGQAGTQEQSASVEESFSNVDPNTLPPELQKIHKQLQADYTRKMQDIADKRKKAESWDSLQKDPRFSDWKNGLTASQKADFKEQKAEAEKRLGETISDEKFAQAFQSKDDFLNFLKEVVQNTSAKSEKELTELKQRVLLNDAADFVDSFATEVGEDGKPIRPDFYALDSDQLITGYLQVNRPADTTREAYAEKLNEAYAWAKGVAQKYYEKGKADALQRTQAKVRASSEPPTTSAKNIYSGPPPKEVSVRDAIELAKKGQRVPQDY